MNFTIMFLMVFLLSFASVLAPKFFSNMWGWALFFLAIYYFLYKRSEISVLSFLAPFAAITSLPYLMSVIIPPYVASEPGFTFSLMAFGAGAVLSLKNARAVFFGLLSGYFMSAVVVAASYGNFTILSEASFWRDQGRMSGCMTDPNTLSLSAFLLLGFLDTCTKPLTKIGIVFLSLILGGATGGRLYLLGATLFFLFYFGRNYRCIPVLAITLGLCVSTLFILPREMMPVGVQRVYDTITLKNPESTLMNRVLFNKVSVSMFLENPIFGVGAGNYKRELLPFSMKALGTWSDNANNFYLQILVEQGIFGMFMFFLTCIHVRRNDSVEVRSSFIALSVFAILLFFGPHVEFLEVSFVCGVLFSKTFYGISPGSRVHFLTMLSAFLLSLFVATDTRGVYPYETDGTFFRWSKERTVLRLPCSMSLWLSSGRDENVKVTYWIQDAHDSLEVGIDPVKVPLECVGASQLVTLTPSKTVTPENDGRALGVKIYLR